MEHHPFLTPSGKIEIFSERLFRMNQPEDIPAVPKYVSAFEGLDDSLREKYPLQMIGWHTKRRTHSTHDCNEKLEKIEKQQAWINLLLFICYNNLITVSQCKIAFQYKNIKSYSCYTENFGSRL